MIKKLKMFKTIIAIATFAVAATANVAVEAPPAPAAVSAGAGCTLGTTTSCETSIAAGLTRQIIAELNVMGRSFRAVNPTWVHCSNNCTLQSAAADALEKAAKSVNDYITVNSAFRSCAQQYLLFNMYIGKRCGITLAALPGQSNHEGGRAIDTSNYNFWLNTLAKFGWKHTYPTTDPVHFDYDSVPNFASDNLKAFQRLANRHANAGLSEDGVYGPATAAALSKAPCSGW